MGTQADSFIQSTSTKRTHQVPSTPHNHPTKAGSFHGTYSQHKNPNFPGKPNNEKIDGT